MNFAVREVSLHWLLDGIAPLPAHDARVCDLTLDSRTARPGSLFFALPGGGSHGVAFAAAAVARGAAVVLWDPAGVDGAGGLPSSVTAGGVFAAAVAGLKQLVGRIADRFFGEPSAQLRVVGITGTNGKTTCAYLLAQCLTRLGRDAAYIGTVGWGRIGALKPAATTTPDAVTVHRQLAELCALGIRDVAMEVSSHALDQARVNGVRFHSAAFTNLTRDHLDYHHTMEAYGAAKARLFTFPGLEHLIIHVGDAFGSAWEREYHGGVPLTAVWVGASEPPPRTAQVLYADRLVFDLKGVALQLDGSFGTRRMTAKLLGRFNVENLVLVIGCLLGLGVSLESAASAVADCTPPPGRLEVIEVGPAKPVAVIDYAHTPDALSKALRTLREHCRGALWCVFGCGGDRDPGKRSVMGAIADQCADHIIVTDDNPRNEDPKAICAAIVRGISAHAVRVIHDRSAAIGTALAEAGAADMVLIAGKGHEDYQIQGAERRRFSDREEALRYLEATA
jgi:UDP-N-acetylmuramoyl-L-alanyl-D-glutamate--2,6-diaminopimelate ligase